MIYAFLTAGGLVFWTILGILALIVAGVGSKSTGWGTFWMAVTALFLFGFTDFELNLFNAGAFLAGYLASGIVVATLKWIQLVRAASKLIQNFDTTKYHDSEVTKTQEEVAYNKFRPDEPDKIGRMALPPVPGEFGPRIGRWIIFWPGFLFERVLDFGYNFVAELGKLGRKLTVGLFSTISHKLYQA